MGLEILSKHGVCCALHISYPRYQDRLDPALLGFDLSRDADKAVFKAPAISLLADALKAVKKAETGARDIFRDRTLSLHYGTGLRFCPAQGLAKLMQGLDEKEAEFKAAAAAFVANFPATVEKMKEDWKETVANQTSFSADVREKLLDQVTKKLPSQAPALDRFGIVTAYLELKTPDTPGLMELEGAEAAVAAEAWTSMKQRAEADAKRFGTDFVSHCRRELMERLQQFFASMQALVEVGKPINKRTVEKVKEFLHTVQTLNFTNDASVQGLTQQLKDAFGPDFTMDSRVEDADVVASVKQCLDQAVTVLGEELMTVHDSGGEDRIGAVLGTAVPGLNTATVNFEF